jgi:hypothetical protein
MFIQEALFWRIIGQIQYKESLLMGEVEKSKSEEMKR